MIPLGAAQLDDADAGVVELRAARTRSVIVMDRQALVELRAHTLPADAPGAWVRAAIDRELAALDSELVDVDQAELQTVPPFPDVCSRLDESTNRRQLDPDDADQQLH